MAGLSRIIAKELSSMLGITDNPKFNPMFKQTDEALEDVSNPATSTIAEFYSPLDSAIENAPIGKQGTRGENIEAFVRKRAPKVTQAELDYREFSLDPARKYTRVDNSGSDFFEAMGDEGALTEFSGIGNLVDTYVYKNNQQALKDAMSDPDYSVYLDVLKTNLNKTFPSGKIPVRRHKNYLTKRPEESFNTKYKIINAKDILFASNISENEVIVKEGDKFTSYFIDNAVIGDGMEPLNIKAVKKRPANQTMQRQGDLLDPEVGYEEIGVDIVGANLGLMTHYGPNNLAHARYSLRQNTTKKPRFDDDPDYTFIEELQSDVIQNMTDNPAKFMKESIAKFRLDFNSNIDDIAFKSEFEMPGSLFEEFDDFVFNELIPIGVNRKLQEERTPIIRELFEKRGYKAEGVYLGTAVGDMFKAMSFDKLNISEFSGMDNILSQMNNEFKSAVANVKVSVSKKDVPINKITDSVRVLLQSIIADSKAKGIDEIVLPPIEKLAEKRFGTNPDGSLSKAYKKAITKGSGFHNTYVVAYDKALKQLKAELGNQIKIGTKDLTYVEEGDFVILKGKSLNIKDLKLDPKKSKLRLNKGGLVQRPDR
jgi:hypothetical protein